MLGRQFAPQCPRCPHAVGVARVAMFKGRMRIVTYVCESCEHEWTLDESRATVNDRATRSDDAPRARMKCSSCAPGFGDRFVVTRDDQAQIARYVCRSCQHEWTVTLPSDRT